MNAHDMLIYLAGGGDEVDSKAIDEQFALAIDKSKPLIYVPNARQADEYAAGDAWIRAAMGAFGISTIETWSSLRIERPISEVSGIYIGGGNTSKLLYELRDSGFDSFLHQAAAVGLPIYGGSAGAIVLGEDIRTAPESRSAMDDRSKGLRIVEGLSIVCHFSASETDEVLRLSHALDQTILAIPEKSGVLAKNGLLTIFGSQPACVLSRAGVATIEPTQSYAPMMK